jgi:hypothetical protein
VRRLLVLAAALGMACQASAARASDFVQFPRDEHQHVDGWDYWWGAADLVSASGNRYTLAMAYTVFDGGASVASSYQLFPRQGPYAGRAIATIDGPHEWGHPSEPADRIAHSASLYVPGASDLLRLDAADASHGMKLLDRWERTSLASPSYRLRIDQDDAVVHPGGRPVRFGADIATTMGAPLLAGGTGQWWYGIPQSFGYPSRSFQYMQASRTIAGTFEVTLPDGTLLRERVDPGRSSLFMVHEYDATPEDIPAGLAAREATQLHPRYPTYYNDDWPWELVFADLRNGAQLMLAVMAFNDTPQGTLRPVTPGQPTYQVLATLRLPDGTSVALDDRRLDVEHLDRRFFDGVNSASNGTLLSLVTQTWRYRVRYSGGDELAPDGRRVAVPPFDLGLVPPFAKDQPLADADGNRLAQRVPFDVAGSYGGCPVMGFAWSELLTNWYGQEDQDPWWTGGALPPVPARCGAALTPPGTPQRTTAPPSPAPNTTTDGCAAPPDCRYDATSPGGVGGSANAGGDWTIEITRPGRPDPIVIRARSGFTSFPCGTVRPGDHVAVEAHASGAEVFAGNPGFCL